MKATLFVAALAGTVTSAVAEGPPCFRSLDVTIPQLRSVDVRAMSDDGRIIAGDLGPLRVLVDGDVSEFYGIEGPVHAISGDKETLVGVFGANYREPCPFSSQDPFANTPMRYTDRIGVMPLSLQDISTGTARCVDETGLIIAGDFRLTGVDVAFVWDPVGGYAELPLPAGFSTSGANDMSRDGAVIVGWMNGPSGQRPARWGSADVVLLEWLPGSNVGTPVAVSGNGETIVGVSSAGGHGVTATIWDGDAPPAAIVPPTAEFPESIAEDISTDGRICVGALLGQGGERQAFFWSAEHGSERVWERLTELGLAVEQWQLLEANVVSGDGTMIAGKGVGPQGTDAWLARIWDHPTYCEGDLNQDDRVDVADLAILLAAFGESQAGDYDCDCRTDLSDLALLLADFGNSCD